MTADQRPERFRLVVEADSDDEGSREGPVPLISRLGPGLESADAAEHDEPEENGTDRRGRLLPVVLASVALFAFAGVIWYAYNWGFGTIAPEELPLIRAEQGSAKVRPESPGGLEIPYQDRLVLNEITPDPDKPQVERLLPPPEVPKPPKPAAPALAQALTTEAGPAPAGDAAAVSPEPSAPAPSGATPPASAEAAAPGQTVRRSAIPPPPASEAGASRPAPPRVPAAKPPAPAPQRTQSAALPAGGGGFLVQLASMKSRDAVRAEWERLQARFPRLLGNRTLTVQTVDIAGRGTFHRVQAGVFPNRAGAEAVCSRLKAGKQDCFVVRR